MRRIAAVLVVLSALALGFQDRGSAQQARALSSAGEVRVTATGLNDVRAWDTFVTTGERSGQLRMRSVNRDPSLPARVVEWLRTLKNLVSRSWPVSASRAQ